METSDFSSLWLRFIDELDARHQRFYSEIEACWNNLAALLQKQADRISNGGWEHPPAGNLSSVLDVAKTEGAIFLFDPMLALKKARPQERALNAIDDYQSGIEDIVRLLPKTISVSRKDLQNSLNWKGKRFRHLLLHLRRKPVSFRLREAVRQILLEHSAQRAKCDGRLLLLLSRGTLSLLIPWQFMRNDALKVLGGSPSNSHALEEASRDWRQMILAIKNTGERCLTEHKLWRQRLSGLLTGAMLAGDGRLSDRRRNRARDRWQDCFRFWSGQHRVIVAQLELESSSARLMEKATAISGESLASVDEEHTQLISELEKASQWLTDWQTNHVESPFPPPEARLLSAEDRADEWKRKLEAAGRVALPAGIESVDLKRILPGRGRQHRSIAAEDCFVRSLSDIGRGTARTGFGEAEEGHRAIVREIERAREVAAYSIEVGRSESEDEESRQVVRDGIANALSLLAYQKKSVTDYHPVVERRLTEALVSTFLQFHLRMEESLLGLFKHLARQKGSQVVHTGVEATISKIKAGSRWLRDRTSQVNKYMLARLGWSPPSTVAIRPVIRREYLGEILNLKAGPRELPAIYRRLFRLAPVEDQRFLVGREAEMAAAAQARSFWEEGRAVAILVAGARGSGKTSFLNCACTAVFGDLPVMSGQFIQRITTAHAMQSFLASLLQTDEADLRSRLKSAKQLIVLEEVERTYIRRIGGFQGLRALLDLIAATSGNVLWILSLNEVALRYLTRVISIEEYFSHRINAMAVAPQHLRNAILLRHNLSGLRLHFAEPPPSMSRNIKVRQLFGLEKDAEQNFFDSLYRQSEGIFRSAFELWQQSVDRVEGGVLYMLHPVDPSFEGVISRFTLEDTFILQSILQHGSLTPEEISQIFDYSPERSNSRIEKLIAWEIIEADPNSPGFRVRPEAGRVVREALYRQNLL
ncbi:MAG: hypothetical protein JXA73_10250 [Acidobacteria bacterium]|nr:hypothetical protein [Acidobacteriota bacterium]